MVLPSSHSRPDTDYPDRFVIWIRGLLLGVALGLIGVFSIALWINPYAADGTAERMATHQQLGLPPCTFQTVTQIPCPACGMTTSFSLLARGDVLHSMQANWVGTLLASFCLLTIPWALMSAYRGRPLFIRSMEQSLIIVVLSLLTLMLLRWILVLGMMRYEALYGHSSPIKEKHNGQLYATVFADAQSRHTGNGYIGLRYGRSDILSDARTTHGSGYQAPGQQG